MLTAGGDPVIGVWATASRKAMTVLNGNGTKTESGNWVQVSRLGNPLVNEVVIGLNQKDLFNASSPSGDVQFLSRVTDPILGTYLNAFFPGLGGGSAPEHNRNDLVTVFLTGIQGLNQPAHLTAPGEELRLNMSIAPVLLTTRTPAKTTTRIATADRARQKPSLRRMSTSPAW